MPTTTTSTTVSPRRAGDPAPDLLGIALAHRAMLADLLRLGDLAAAVRDRALAGGARAADWADLWSRLTEWPDRAAGLNLDRGEVLASALNDLERTKARAC